MEILWISVMSYSEAYLSTWAALYVNIMVEDMNRLQKLENIEPTIYYFMQSEMIL